MSSQSICKQPLYKCLFIPARVRNAVLSLKSKTTSSRYRAWSKDPDVKLQDLLDMTAEELLERRNIGPESIRQTQKALRPFGLSLKMRPGLQEKLEAREYWVVVPHSKFAMGPYTQDEAEEYASRCRLKFPQHQYLITKVQEARRGHQDS